MLFEFALGLVLSSSGAGSSQPQGPDLTPQVTEAVIHATPAELWKVWSTAEGHKKLGVASCDIDFRIGGLIRAVYDPRAQVGDPSTIVNEIVAYEPERMIAFRIHQPPKEFAFPNAWQRTWWVATMTDLGDGTTLLRIAGMGYDTTAESQKLRDFLGTGNAYVMQVLQSNFPASSTQLAGSLPESNALDPIEMAQVIELPREAVWKLFATSRGWTQMIADSADIQLRPGGKFEIRFDRSAPPGEQGSEGCTVLSVIPNEMLSYSWNSPPKLAFARTKHSWVVLRFDALTPSTTRVRLSHQGFAELAAEYPDHREEFAETRKYFDRAWGVVLARALKQGSGN